MDQEEEKEQDKVKNESMLSDLSRKLRELNDEKKFLLSEIYSSRTKLASLENVLSILKEQVTACELSKKALLQTLQELNNLKESLRCEISALREDKDRFEAEYKDVSINTSQIDIIESSASIELAINAALEEAWLYTSERDQARSSMENLKALEDKPQLLNSDINHEISSMFASHDKNLKEKKINHSKT